MFSTAGSLCWRCTVADQARDGGPAPATAGTTACDPNGARLLRRLGVLRLPLRFPLAQRGGLLHGGEPSHVVDAGFDTCAKITSLTGRISNSNLPPLMPLHPLLELV